MSILDELERNRAIYLAMTRGGGVIEGLPLPQSPSPPPVSIAASNLSEWDTDPIFPAGQPTPTPLQAPDGIDLPDDRPLATAGFSLQRTRSLAAITDIAPPQGLEAVPRAEAEPDPLTALEERIETRSRLGSQLLTEEEF